jgi:hypothetical protein
VIVALRAAPSAEPRPVHGEASALPPALPEAPVSPPVAPRPDLAAGDGGAAATPAVPDASIAVSAQRSRRRLEASASGAARPAPAVLQAVESARLPAPEPAVPAAPEPSAPAPDERDPRLMRH